MKWVDAEKVMKLVSGLVMINENGYLIRWHEVSSMWLCSEGGFWRGANPEKPHTGWVNKSSEYSVSSDQPFLEEQKTIANPPTGGSDVMLPGESDLERRVGNLENDRNDLKDALGEFSDKIRQALEELGDAVDWEE